MRGKRSGGEPFVNGLYKTSPKPQSSISALAKQLGKLEALRRRTLLDKARKRRIDFTQSGCAAFVQTMCATASVERQATLTAWLMEQGRGY